MIKGTIKRLSLEEGWEVNLEFMGYGNHNIIDAFRMEGIDIKKQMEEMPVGKIYEYNIL